MALYPVLTVLNPGTVGTQSFGQEQVAIFDDTTGLPANGNNMVVQVSVNINGAISTVPITVGGLTSPIWSGMLRDTATGYFTSFAILSYVEGAGTAPDPAADDLTIVSVITTPETALGADDGTVTINATSSFPAITYSLDGVTYQSSNVFTGQISGAGTAYAKDTNGGLESVPYTVGLLGNILTSDPTVDLGNGNLSRWNAAFNNIWFKYQRKDFEITSITEDISTGNILVAVNADVSKVTPQSSFVSPVFGVGTVTTPGDVVYIQTANYSGSYTVLSVNAGSLVLDCPYVANDGTGFINIDSLRPYYKVQTIITGVSQLTGKFVTIISNNSPNEQGLTQVDLSSFLQSLLRAQDQSYYNLVNYRDMQLSASYTIQYAEVWNGNTPQFATITRPYYILWAARQLQQIGGGNLQEFVPYPLGFQPAKWVTDFINPVYNYRFPFDIGFIFSEYMVGLAPYYTVILLDINMQPLANQTIPDGFLLNDDGSYILNEDGSKFIIASGALETGLVEHVGLNRLLVNFEPPSLCWYFKLQIFYDFTPVSGSVVTYPLTQAITCRVDQNTPDRQVYIRWIGLTGCWQYYTFSYNQQSILEVSNTVTVKNFVIDWFGTDTIADVISKSAMQKMTIYGLNISVDDIQAIRGIRMSPKVQLYVGPVVSGYNWLTINSGDASYQEFETFINEYAVTITFALPQVNLQFQ